MPRYYCKKLIRDLTRQEVNEHRCFNQQRKNKHRRTGKKQFFKCDRLIVLPKETRP